MIVHIATPRTIADGAQTQHLGYTPVEVIRRHVDDIVTGARRPAGRCHALYAQRMARGRAHRVPEPGAAFEAGDALRGQRVGIVVGGGNGSGALRGCWRHELVPEDIKAIERNSFDAVPPESLHACGPWLVAIDPRHGGPCPQCRCRCATHGPRRTRWTPSKRVCMRPMVGRHVAPRVPAAGEYDALRATALGRAGHHGQTHQHLHVVSTTALAARWP